MLFKFKVNVLISGDVLKECICFGYIYETIHNKVYFIFNNTADFAQPLTRLDFDTDIAMSSLFYI